PRGSGRAAPGTAALPHGRAAFLAAPGAGLPRRFPRRAGPHGPPEPRPRPRREGGDGNRTRKLGVPGDTVRLVPPRAAAGRTPDISVRTRQCAVDRRRDLRGFG